MTDVQIFPSAYKRVSPLLQFGGKELREEEQTAESIKSQMTEKEWEKVFEMSQDKNLYHNLCTSLFPTIHGQGSSLRPAFPVTVGAVVVC